MDDRVAHTLTVRQVPTGADATSDHVRHFAVIISRHPIVLETRTCRLSVVAQDRWYDIVQGSRKTAQDVRALWNDAPDQEIVGQETTRHPWNQGSGLAHQILDYEGIGRPCRPTIHTLAHVRHQGVGVRHARHVVSSQSLLGSFDPDLDRDPTIEELKKRSVILIEERKQAG